MAPQLVKKQAERRTKERFPIQRELRYKILEHDTAVETGVGETIDIASGGVAFQIGRPLRTGEFVELSVSWPVMLDDKCPMRLVFLGRVVRCVGHRAACRIDKYEFRTQARRIQPVVPLRQEDPLRRWNAGGRQKAATASGF